MVGALALMESPAIIVGLLLVKFAAPKNRPNARKMHFRSILHESLLNGSVYLLLSSLIVGFLTAFSNPSGILKMEPFTGQLLWSRMLFPFRYGNSCSSKITKVEECWFIFNWIFNLHAII